jgi:hypothetical protein
MIEVFNLNHYVIDAAAVNPALAVSTTSTILYSLSGLSPDRVFVEHMVTFTVNGNHVDRISIPTITTYLLNGHPPGDIGISVATSTVYMLRSESTDKVTSAVTATYLITS